VKLRREDGRWEIDGDWYRLSGVDGGAVALLDDADGRRWAELRLLASAHTRAGEDETFTVDGPTVVEKAGDGIRLSWTLDGSRWTAKRLLLDAAPETVTVRVEVEGRGDLTEVWLLAGRAVQPRASGLLMSGSWCRSLVAGAPGDPGRIVQPSAESASIGVASGSEPGRGRWFFSPGPFVFAANRDVADDPLVLPAGPWLGFAVDAVAGAAGFTEVAWRAAEHGFGIVLEYDGHTRVDGRWTSPPLVLSRAADPYAAIAAQHERKRDAGGPSALGTKAAGPAWWREPIFCGWGAQSAAAAAAGLPMSAAPARATRANYDDWLGRLEGRGVVPGTVVLDDKWQATYGPNEPDVVRWPDLPGWIATRHERGQRVLLWYKAWDAEGLPPEACIRSTAGTPLGIDPTSPAGEAAIRATIRSMLHPAGLDADGLKIDFTARTPTGRATEHQGPEWGVDLLARLLGTIADEARRVRADPLLIGQTPNPVLAPFVDMIRLNDALRLDDPEPALDVVPQMRHRAAIARAACPDHLIDTDDWCMPDLARWRAYATIQPELGVPALYYVDRMDRTDEHLEERDFALLRRTWAAYRRREGLPVR
jgi:hypothetical protein